MGKILKKQKAITLIALVITIVVLVILSAVAINLSLGNSGIFNKAKLAKEEYLQAANEEQAKLANLELTLGTSRDTVTLTTEQINQLKTEIYNQILEDINPVNLSTQYSTEEQAIGTWINGDTLYQKTIQSGKLNVGDYKNVAHGISNLNKVVRIFGIGYDKDGVIYPIPFVDDPAYLISLSMYGSNVRVWQGPSLSQIQDSYVTIQYTKN